MCGIAGVASLDREISPRRLDNMRDALSHRGPDGAGSWISPLGQVGLAHRRLSVMDLSQAGAQPMHSTSGRFSISFNGEIYNFRNLRKNLEGVGMQFVGHSDTEIILAACEHWGFLETLNRLEGMFALAIWDSAARILYLARDRMGIKPLYYQQQNGELIFASELRPLITWSQRLPPISRRGLNEYLRLGYVPCPLSIFEQVWKLPPGNYMTWHSGNSSDPKPYWKYSDEVFRGRGNYLLDENDALITLEGALRASVKRQMVSDVPVGAFLSGGIDSSIVAALMQEESNRPIKTFTIGFSEDEYNEAKYAARVAAHIGTDHTELYISEADARRAIPDLSITYDEPFADISQIPTILLSQLARKEVTVALSGDGGDELFLGYNRYIFVSSYWKNLQMLPLSLRRLASACLCFPSVVSWDQFFGSFGRLLPFSLHPNMVGQKIHKIGAILPAASLRAVHGRLVSQWVSPELALSPEWRFGQPLWEEMLSEDSACTPPIQQAIWDAQTYMVDDILTKVDRASMRFGLEVRVPLLDNAVIEAAWRMPEEMKLRNGEGKWLLRQLLYKFVPQSLVDRPKMGFGVPIDGWLRDGLRDWAESYLNEKRLKDEGHFDVHVIRQTWTQHQQGTHQRGGPLWTVLMFQHWLDRARQWV